jgi:S1-C subfamily serine protease
VNLLDVIIIIIAIAAMVRGVESGFLRQFGSLGGFLIGLILGAAVAPWFASLFSLTTSRSLVVVLVFFAVALAISGLGEAIGAYAASLMQRIRLGELDGLLGAVFGFVATLLAVWLLAATFGGSVGPPLDQDIQTSAILRTLDHVLPPAPEVISRFERTIGASKFPQVFAGLEPTPAPPVTGPNAEAVNAAAAIARSATVKIEGVGCGGIQEGSGFVVGPGLVATNAHVVAGIAGPQVIDGAGRHNATVVLFDPDLDIAVLRTTGLAAPALPVSSGVVPRGTLAVALGYPGGGSFTAGAAAVLERQTAVGRNIYDSGLISRDIYVLQAVVRPGNSGGPLVGTDGTVIGVVFATSTTNPDVGYALTSAEILPDIARARSSAPTSTGACIAE